MNIVCDEDVLHPIPCMSSSRVSKNIEATRVSTKYSTRTFRHSKQNISQSTKPLSEHSSINTLNHVLHAYKKKCFKSKAATTPTKDRNGE